jgi:hypothetical protein
MSKIALGTVQFGIDYGVNSVDGQVRPEEVKKILSYAHSKDIDLLDAAPAYGNSEKILGRMDISNFKVVTKTRHFDSLEIKNNDVKLQELKQAEKIDKNRKQIFDELRENGIGVNVQYIPIHTQPYYSQLGFRIGDFPNSESYYNRAISIPLFHTMTTDQQDEVVRTLRKVLQ